MKYMTAGESHGKALVAIIEGFPAHLKVDINELNVDLARRQMGYGRGGRMRIETDKMEILAGVRNNETLASPIAFIIPNADHAAWKDIMNSGDADILSRRVTCVRPGHADLAGCIKYAQNDARNILERASARETAARVGVGSFARIFLKNIGITVASHVTNIGGARTYFAPMSAVGLNEIVDKSVVRCGDVNAEKEMIKIIDNCMLNGDTVGGEVELIASGVPVGVGGCMQVDQRLDYVLSCHLAAIQAVKSVGFGLGARVADQKGSIIHDEIGIAEDGKIVRKSNNAGGVEGGISNGENIVIRLSVKPIPTLMNGLASIDLDTKKSAIAASERSDFCAVPACGVVGEAVLCYCLADAIMRCVGGDTMEEICARVQYMREKTIV